MTTAIPLPQVDAFIGHVSASLASGSFVRLLLTKPVADTATERIIGRMVVLRGEPVLSLTLREPKRDTTRNLPLAEVPTWLAGRVPAAFRSAVVETTDRNWQLSPSPRGGLQLVAHRATHAATPPRDHDAAGNPLLDARAQPWLIALGLCAPDGKVRARMADKHRQLERFLEILAHLVKDAALPPGGDVKVVDMGCGKGLLTFGVWHLLRHALGLPAEVTGVEARAELVDTTNAVARATGCDGLRFVAARIDAVELPPRLDLLIALHACDTATDDAIRRGIMAGARILVVSPCCHQELRPRMGAPEPLAPLLAHGILAERMAEWLTDGLRALHLEAAGYATRVIEFVGAGHTPRNLLLAGVLRPAPAAADRDRALARIRALKDFFGVERHALDGV